MNAHVDHFAADHPPCGSTVCVVCLQRVPCDEYFANDHACTPCAEGPAPVTLLATTNGGFFPEGVRA